MSNYAKVLNGKVLKVIVADAEYFNTFVDSSPGTWLQTSYNTRGNVHYGQNGQPDGGVALRANYAGIGYTLNTTVVQNGVVGVFYAPQPYPSWILNTQTYLWEAPVPYPSTGGPYYWDEATLSWVEVA